MDAVAYALAMAVPALTGTFEASVETAKTALPATRREHGQGTLSDGTVLVTGGKVAGSASADVQSYDPSTNAWTSKTAMPATRYLNGQSTLSDGTVLVTAGLVGGSLISATMESYDPATDAWTTKTALSAGLYWHDQSVLSDGTVLVTGGQLSAGATADVKTYELGDPIGTTGRAALAGYLAAN